MRGKLVVKLLVVSACMMASLGCRDKEREQALAEAEQAKKSVLRLEAQLNTAKSEMAFLQEQLDAVTETRDELDQQLRQLVTDRDYAVATSKVAQERTKTLTARLGQQSNSSSVFQNENEQLKAIIKDHEGTIAEQQATIDELSRIIAQMETITEQPVAQEINEQPDENVEEQPEQIIDPNELPEQP